MSKRDTLHAVVAAGEAPDGSGGVALVRSAHGSETRARSLILKLRVDAAEREAIRAAASRAGLEVGSYLRARALDGPAPPRAVRRPPVEKAAVAQMLAMLGPVAEEVRALRRAFQPPAAIPANTDVADRLNDTCDAIQAMRTLLMHALGRVP